MPSQTFTFHQLDVFTATPLRGNPLAVVIAADDLTPGQMSAFANWTNLSETTFLLQPTHPHADYRVRIFTPRQELPFAGHPTLGTCHAWLATGGIPKSEKIIQECGLGLIEIARTENRLAFAAPPLRRAGPLNPNLLTQIAASLRIPTSDITAHSFLDNGAPWLGIMLDSREKVLALNPDFAAMGDLWIGVIGPAKNQDFQFEVRAFSASEGFLEDPVTGSLNAGLASWLIPAGLAPPSYIAAQGTVLGRDGRIHITQDLEEKIWAGGDVVTCIQGTLTL